MMISLHPVAWIIGAVAVLFGLKAAAWVALILGALALLSLIIEGMQEAK